MLPKTNTRLFLQPGFWMQWSKPHVFHYNLSLLSDTEELVKTDDKYLS